MDTDDLIMLARLRARLADGTARQIREQAGLRRAEVADAVKVSTATLQRWEVAAQSPCGPPALRYARVLDRLAQLADPAECLTTP
jgi:DNA-binding transcriptional regulator YiaG